VTRIEAATPDAALWANGRRLPDPAEAASEFESFLLAEIWKRAQDGPRWSKLLGDGSAEATTRAMWIEELVGRAVAARGLGLAAAIEQAPAAPGSGEDRR